MEFTDLSGKLENIGTNMKKINFPPFVFYLNSWCQTSQSVYKIMAEKLLKKPNILITGTPGVGKSFLAEKLAQLTGLTWVNIGEVAEANNCYEEYDEQYQCYVLDEDKVIDVLDEQISAGGNIVDYHGSDFFPKRWFDIVFVLRTDTEQLYERLSNRNYSAKKLEDNIQCEIFQMMLEEAKTSYDEDIVHELRSNTLEDFNQNLENIVKWLSDWESKPQ